ncbi:ATP-dependent (S)-NAD(P)H-hydrate dehydratase [Anabrus simplex]|uniref:ATP-dependent (S)-NAD(P)H-hydrate dehydratase n=1 Tax=Anabrus simplex TaxID=316456 RepID=UPI0034DD8A7F
MNCQYWYCLNGFLKQVRISSTFKCWTVINLYENSFQRFLTSSAVSSETKMESGDGMSPAEKKLLEDARLIVPSLSQSRHKGQAGRIGVIGGSVEYTGAPYFSAISALRVGCDLAHVFCLKEAAPVIKSYSPELIVHPVLDSDNAVELIKPWLDRLHVLIIGPGLGRDSKVFATVASLIEVCRSEEKSYQKPLVIDADGLFMITEKPDIIRNYPHGAILTPNAIEFTRLAKSVLGESWSPSPEPKAEHVQALAAALGPNITVVHKGKADIFAHGQSKDVWHCSGGGTGRRCGGQGDLLSGSLGTFYAWALMAHQNYSNKLSFPSSIIAAYAGCRLTRECNSYAFVRAGRSTVTTDMIDVIHPVFEKLYGE